jgi:vacuolar protein sorting-associated protein 13A/C
MQVAEPGYEPLQLFSSANGSVERRDLLRVDYTRVQSSSPEYLSKYEGYDQIISVDVSTVIFRVAPEPLVTLYNFIMTTFVPSSPTPGEIPSSAQTSSTVPQPTPESLPEQPTRKLRLLVKLASVEGGNFVLITRVDVFDVMHSYIHKCGCPHCNTITIDCGRVRCTK